MLSPRCLFARLLIGCLLAVTVAGVQAEIPQSFSYQGFMTDSAGMPIGGSRQVTFKLYAQPGDPVALWSQTVLLDFNTGIFQASLGGAAATLPATIFTNPVWLGLTMHEPNGTPNAEMSPRQPLQSAPFSFQAQNAELLTGFEATELDQSAHVINTANPHAVTASQVGSPTQVALDTALANKADNSHSHPGNFYSQAEVDALVQQLQGANTALAARVTLLESVGVSATLQSLQAQITTLQNADDTAAALMQFVAVKGTDIVFEGANVHVRNGSNDQQTSNGLGNLTIGYNPGIADPPVQTGSHNLVLGSNNGFTATGSIVSGEGNLVSATDAAAIGGAGNTVSGAGAVSVAGNSNQATAGDAAIVGGYQSVASGYSSFSAGGWQGAASGTYSVRLGGRNSNASGREAVAIGGFDNSASGPYSLVVGGINNAINSSDPDNANNLEGALSVILGGQKNSLDSLHAVIVGGDSNNINRGTGGTRGDTTTIVGGKGNIASGNLALIAGGEGNRVDSSNLSGLVGRLSNIYGGLNNTIAGGSGSAIIGGQNNVANTTRVMIVGGDSQTGNTVGGVEVEVSGLAVVESDLLALQALFGGVSRTGNNLYFDGLNLHLRNGTGATAVNNALGNLTIGYNELRSGLNIRVGSHNLVMGVEQSYQSYASIVHGRRNFAGSNYGALIGTIGSVISVGEAGAIIGGSGNLVSGISAVVLGGQNNQASGTTAAVVGGENNQASGSSAAVLGGENNQAGRDGTTLRGGRNGQTSN